MTKYAGLIDKLIIFICCLILFAGQPAFNSTVGPILLSVIFSGFLSYFEDEKLRLGLTLGFSVLALYMPELTAFLPLIAFDMVFCKYQYINLFALIPLIYFILSNSASTASITIVTLILSVLARYRLELFYRLHSKHIMLHDEATEISIQLKRQNQNIIEKQDTELTLATLNERNRIAREIHDNVGHLLSRAILQSGALLAVNKNERLEENLQTLNNTLTQAMNSIRMSVHDLYDESLDLNILIEEILKNFTFCELHYDCSLTGNPGKRLKYTFVAIIREALSNIIKHSNATHASIIFREHPAFYQLIIRDNGNVKSYCTDEGLGLNNITDRVLSFGGIINIKNENGFEIFISIPKEDHKN